MKRSTKTTATHLARVGAGQIVASEEPRKPGVPREGRRIIAAVKLLKEEVGDFDTASSRIDIVELFGAQWNPRPLPRSEEAAGKKLKRIFEVITTNEGEVIVCPHLPAQQIIAGRGTSEKKAAASKTNALLGGRPKLA